MKEIYKPIEGYKGLYEISNLGNVKSLNYNKTGREQILKPAKDKNGYLRVVLYKEKKQKKYLVHKLVGSAFIPNPDNKPQINHLDENKTNNCVSNLNWVTPKENTNYGTRNERASKALKGKLKGRKQSQESILKRSIAVVQLDLNNNFIGVHQSSRQIERDLGFDHSSINRCCKGRYKSAYKFKWQFLSDYIKQKAS